jgi:hypothetical protein
MKHAIFCLLALAAGGCATAPQAVEQDPASPALLQDIPVLGPKLEQPKSAQTAGGPLLKDIPILGFFFRGTEKEE